VKVGNGEQSKGERLLQRHFPGVDVIRTPLGGVRIRILSGLVGDAEPLYVVDGTPLEVAPGRGLDWLTPEQIARIEVLTHPAETLIYGPRGVHGVIVITTKR
jgi:outer membrane receptor for ferrienterochelin and colicin